MSIISDGLDSSGADLPAGGEPQAEPLGQMLKRWTLGAAWAVNPPRTRDVPAVLYFLARHYLHLGPGDLPDPDRALGSGVAGICPDLNPETLMRGYATGLYPFAHIGPLKWLAPRERMVLFLEEFGMEGNLRRRLRNKHFRVTFDRAFGDVIRGCAAPREGRTPLTWITPRVIDAFTALHEMGHAHSVEVWDREGNLAGGVYGLSVGQVFFTESQFNRKRDAAKVGFATLNCHLAHWGYALNDVKRPSGHLASVGCRLIPRARFNAILSERCPMPGHAGRWLADDTLDVGRWDPKTGVVPRLA